MSQGPQQQQSHVLRCKFNRLRIVGDGLCNELACLQAFTCACAIHPVLHVPRFDRYRMTEVFRCPFALAKLRSELPSQVKPACLLWIQLDHACHIRFRLLQLANFSVHFRPRKKIIGPRVIQLNGFAKIANRLEG